MVTNECRCASAILTLHDEQQEAALEFGYALPAVLQRHINMLALHYTLEMVVTV